MAEELAAQIVSSARIADVLLEQQREFMTIEIFLSMCRRIVGQHPPTLATTKFACSILGLDLKITSCKAHSTNCNVC